MSAPIKPYKTNARILLVDDDPLVLQTIENTLRDQGHEIRATSHGETVVRFYRRFKPDIVITDVILPEVDTLDTIEELRRLDAKVKIIAISGNPYLLTLAAKLGATYVLAKPFGAGQLLNLLQVALQ